MVILYNGVIIIELFVFITYEYSLQSYIHTSLNDISKFFLEILKRTFRTSAQLTSDKLLLQRRRLNNLNVHLFEKCVFATISNPYTI